MTLPSQGTVLSQKLLAGGVRAGGGLVPWLNVTSQCHRAVPLLCLCCQHHQLLPRDRWMWPHPLALTSSLLLLPFTRDPKRAGPVQGMLCRTRVAMEPPGVGLWGLRASTVGLWSCCWAQPSLPAALWMPRGAGITAGLLLDNYRLW